MAALRLLVAFVIGVIVGLIVYAISTQVAFLAGYASLIALLFFLIGCYVSYRYLPLER